MTDKEIFEAVKQRFTDPKVMDLLRAGLADKNEMEDVKRAIRYGDAAMRNPILRDKLYKIFDRLLNVVKDDSTTRQMVKQDLRQLQKKQGDSAMSEDLNTANVEKAVMHDCAKHVVHEEWGKGQCIFGEHTLLDDGTVTHYDVMFEHGIEQNVAIEELTVLVSEKHPDDKNHRGANKKMTRKVMEAEEMAAVTPEGGEADAGKASRKDLKMPLEKLKAIMEKKKMKMKKMMEEVELDEAAKTGSVRYSDDGTITHRVLHSSGQNHLTMTHHNEHPGNIKFHGKMDGHTIKFTANPKNKNDFDPSSKDINRDLKQAHPSLPPEVHSKVLNHATSGLKRLSLDEAKAPTVPKTAKEKDLAALAPPHDKITHADVMVGRGVGKKKSLKEFVKQLSESLLVESNDHILVQHPFTAVEDGHPHAEKLITDDGELTNHGQKAADHFHKALNLINKHKPEGARLHSSYGEEDDQISIKKGSPAHELIKKHLDHTPNSHTSADVHNDGQKP